MLIDATLKNYLQPNGIFVSKCFRKFPVFSVWRAAISVEDPMFWGMQDFNFAQI